MRLLYNDGQKEQLVEVIAVGGRAMRVKVGSEEKIVPRTELKDPKTGKFLKNHY